jgi:succinyl-CoA synthetase beta subunit
MKLLEYQAKQQFAAAGIEIPAGRLARTPEEAVQAARDLGRIAIKAQVPIGGRGKAGGIAVVDSPEDARAEAERILGMDIRGYPVHSVWCERGLQIDSEFYLGITLDRDRRSLVLIFSVSGGMDIEQVAAETPEKIAKLWPDPWEGPHAFEVRALAFAALRGDSSLKDRSGAIATKLAAVAQTLYKVATSLDATTCEINPLVLTSEGTLVAADGKLEIDDNAAFRHKDIAELVERDATQSGPQTGDDPFEAEAQRRGLTYVHLHGDIGCIGNGAGLAMNTLDLVKSQGGDPANFLDVGGGASAEKVRNALEMVLLDTNVKGVFINIFGGITRGDEVARGVVQARDELHLTKPLVVRLTGTREAEGLAILKDAGITPASSALEGARAIVEQTSGTRS